MKCSAIAPVWKWVGWSDSGSPAIWAIIGEPSSHVRWLDALELGEGESALQVGAGAGYYTAILGHLVGANGKVYAYEIDQNLGA